jgi:hypothetical protein
MTDIGILSPKGVFYKCSSYEHLDLAYKIITVNYPNLTNLNQCDCEEYLHLLGYISIRVNDVYGLIGYLDKNKDEIHLTEQQKEWLISHYENMNELKRKSVDYMIDILDK